MELKLDAKTLVVGIVLGVAITISLGAVNSNVNRAEWGIAIENNGFAIVKSDDGTLYTIDPEAEKAKIITVGSYTGGALNLSKPGFPTKNSSE